MNTPHVHAITFVDQPDLPEVHADERRTLYERTTAAGRVTRSVITADEVVLGNHYHDFDQHFTGRGEGILYTAPKDKPNEVVEQVLPAAGWEFDIPAGVVMALRLYRGAVHVFASNHDYAEGKNTHRMVIAK